jgi:hypothetical protein
MTVRVNLDRWMPHLVAAGREWYQRGQDRIMRAYSGPCPHAVSLAVWLLVECLSSVRSSRKTVGRNVSPGKQRQQAPWGLLAEKPRYVEVVRPLLAIVQLDIHNIVMTARGLP